MSKGIRSTLLVLVAGCSSLAAAQAQDDPEVRKELEAQYKKLAEAHDRQDLKAIVGLKTADFHSIFPDGRVGDSKVMEQYSRQFLEGNQPPYDIRVTIQSAPSSENKPTAVRATHQLAPRPRPLPGKRRR